MTKGLRFLQNNRFSFFFFFNADVMTRAALFAKLLLFSFSFFLETFARTAAQERRKYIVAKLQVKHRCRECCNKQNPCFLHRPSLHESPRLRLFSILIGGGSDSGHWSESASASGWYFVKTVHERNLKWRYVALTEMQENRVLFEEPAAFVPGVCSKS